MKHFFGEKSTVAALSLFIFLFGLVLVYWFALLHHRADISHERIAIAARLDKARGEINREIDSIIHLSQGLVSLIKIQHGITEAQFASMAQEIVTSEPRIRNIALAPGNIIRFVYPLKGNEEALGLDYFKVPDQREAVLRVIREKTTVVAGPVNLVQGGVGIISRTPVFIKDSFTSRLEQRYWGIVSTVIDFNTLIRSAGLNEGTNQDVRFALRGKDGTGADGTAFWGDGKIFAMDPVLMSITLPSGSWQIAALPANGWPVFNPLRSIYFLFGCLLSLIFSILFFQLIRTNQKLLKSNRALNTISRCNQSLVKAIDEKILLDEVCRIFVKEGGYRMAWIGYKEQDEAKSVRSIAQAGYDKGYLEKAKITWADNERGQGPTGIAIRTGTHYVARNILKEPSFAPWREQAILHGYNSSISFPLISNNNVWGVFNLYSTQPDAFNEMEINLLDELINNIVFGIETLHTRIAREKAEKELRKHRDHLEELVKERTTQLELAREKAEAADRIKSAFLAAMSHELRTPLNSIIGFTGMVLQGLAGPLNEEQTKQLGMVRGSARHLLDLINDILDISKIEAGQLQIMSEMFGLRKSIEKAVQIILPLADKKNLRLQFKIGDDVSEMSGDQRRVEQIMINLLSNAVKFTDHGEIIFSCDAGKDSITLSVEDTGIGIKPENLSMIFDAFRQVDSGITRVQEGTGLGLNITKKLVEMMGGSIHVESELGKGSIFTVILPKSRV